MESIRKRAIVTVVTILLAALSLFFADKVFNLRAELPKLERSLESAIVKQIEKQISTPPPLRATQESPKAFLTRAGVIRWTNIERTQNSSYAAFSENVPLDVIAELRMQDMFQGQYFEHVSPEGVGAGEVAEKVGYEFIAIGENIALGNFENDQALVEAWMASPGHRANILNSRYTEIGVAVGKGLFEGKEKWIGVQIFALPLSACPAPDATLRERISVLQGSIDQKESAAIALREELEHLQPKNKREAAVYNQKVEEYNALVREINGLVHEVKSLIAKYNSEVSVFNSCVKG